MKHRLVLFIFLLGCVCAASGQSKPTKTKPKKQTKTAVAATPVTSYTRLPDSLYVALSACNGGDVVLFYKGKSMEFADKNAQALVSFIGQEPIQNIEGFKQIGLYTYKINGQVFLDCDVLLNADQTAAIMRFKKNGMMYYRKMNEEGLKILLQWNK